jgi:hypothetical protein
MLLGRVRGVVVRANKKISEDSQNFRRFFGVSEDFSAEFVLAEPLCPSDISPTRGDPLFFQIFCGICSM